MTGLNVNNIKPLAFSYIRMSTKEQLQGDSLRRQTESSQAYAEQHGLHLLAENELKDIGLSAYTGENRSRGALGIFLEKIQNGDIPVGSYLLVETLDRLSRERVFDALPVFLNILNAGIKVVTLNDGRVFDSGETDPMSIMYSLLLMANAHEESKKKAERVGAAWANKRKLIQIEKLTERCPSWLKLSKNRKSFEVIQDKAATVVRLFEMARDGYGSFSTTRVLNSEQVPNLTDSKSWSKSSIEKILVSRSVLGEFQPHRKPRGTTIRTVEGHPIPDYYPRILDDDLFNAVQAQRDQRRIGGRGRRGNNVANLFSRKAYCHYCGAPIHMVDKGDGPRGGKYLRCSAAIRAYNCTAGSWRYADFEKSFFYFLRNEIDLRSAIDASANRRALRSQQQKLAALNSEIATLEQQRLTRLQLLDQINESGPQINQGTLKFVAEQLTSLSAKITSKAAERSALETEIDRPEKAALTSADDAEQIAAQISSDLERADEASRSRLRSEIANIVVKLELAPDGIEIDQPMMRKGSMAHSLMEKAFGGSGSLSNTNKNKSFYVTLIDGTRKLIGVSDSGPTDFEFRLDEYRDPKAPIGEESEQDEVPLSEDKLPVNWREVVENAAKESTAISTMTGEFKPSKR